jgi:Rieske Fe-S protein
MTHGTLGGRMIADQILGVAVEWEHLYDPRRPLYDPKRKTRKTRTPVTRAELPVARQYGTHLSPGDVASRFDIAPGAGAVVWDGCSKLAVYRDNEGLFHERSAYCTHLGGVVQWNATEGSWDCPCHGSRFAIDGAVLNGPAIATLHAREDTFTPEARRSAYVSPSLFDLRRPVPTPTISSESRAQEATTSSPSSDRQQH